MKKGSKVEVGTPFDNEVAAAQKRLERLGRLAGAGSDRRQLLQEVLQELGIALNELQVAAEDMRQQSVSVAEARHLAEDAHQRYLDLFELGPDAYIVTETHGNIREANSAAADLCGVRSRFLAGKPLGQFFDRGRESAFLQVLRRLERGQDVRGEGMDIKPRDGDPIPVMVDARVQRNSFGTVLSYLWLIHDRRPENASSGSSPVVVRPQRPGRHSEH